MLIAFATQNSRCYVGEVEYLSENQIKSELKNARVRRVIQRISIPMTKSPKYLNVYTRAAIIRK